MFLKKITHYSFIILLLFSAKAMAQVQQEVAPPFNIKTVSFVQNSLNVIPVFELGAGFQLQFDDLYGTNADYFYEITHCDYNWEPSNIPKNEYLQGFDNQRIQTITNSFNTLQIYSHFALSIPNQFTQQLRLSGNYILKILNESREVVFSRKFILYENIVNVPMQIKRARTGNLIPYKHNVDFAINSETINFQNPIKNVKVALFQNGNFNNAIKNIAPQYTMGNNLIYKYDTETQFWAGNEYWYFENKNIRIATNFISRVDTNTDVYGCHLFTTNARANQVYTFAPDVNGNFAVLNANATNSEIEADYAWIYFTLSAPTFRLKKDIYIGGQFNNYQLNPEFKMDYNAEKGLYEKAILIKQGFTNFKYTIANSKGEIDNENAIDGNFYQTENEYTTLVYYRNGIDRYDRVIGKGTASSINIIN